MKIIQPTPTDIAIITNDPVAKTFNGTDCRVLRRIEFVRPNYGASSRTYKVRTDLVRYEESEEIVYDKDNKPTIATKQRLTTIEEREAWRSITLSRAEINALDAQITELLPEGLDSYDRDIKKLQLGLLMLTKQEVAWGVAVSQWRELNSKDLIIDLEE